MKLITTNEYLLLIDEEAEIKEENIAIHDFGMGYDLELPCDKDNLKSNTRKLVIAYYPLTKEAKELDLPLLPNPFEKEIDVEKLAQEVYREYPTNPKDKPDWTYNRDIHVHKKRKAFIKGYKAAQQSDKQFSLEDVKKVIDMARLQGSEPFLCKYSDDEIIQSLSTQQLPVSFEPEYEDYEVLGERDEDGYPLWKKRLKTITNSEGKEVLCGTYKY